jgi:hypothetical protein
MIEVNVPTGGATTVIDQDGRQYHAHAIDGGRVVINLLPREVRALLRGRDGKPWHDANPEALRRLAEFA